MDKTIWANGFQLTPAAMEFLQNEFTGAIGGVVGDISSYVVSGCAVSGGVRTNGWVVINGEIMPFVANTLNTDYVKIQQTSTQNMYSTGTPQSAFYTRYAECAESADGADALFSQMPVMERKLKPRATAWAALEGVASVSTAYSFHDISWYNAFHQAPVEDEGKRWRIDERGNLLVCGVLSLTSTTAPALTTFCPIPRDVKFRCDVLTSNATYGRTLYSVIATIDTGGNLYLDEDDFINPQSRGGINMLLFPMTVIPL